MRVHGAASMPRELSLAEAVAMLGICHAWDEESTWAFRFEHDTPEWTPTMRVTPHGIALALLSGKIRRKGKVMANIFYIIGVIVVVLFVLGYLGLR